LAAKVRLVLPDQIVVLLPGLVGTEGLLFYFTGLIRPNRFLELMAAEVAAADCHSHCCIDRVAAGEVGVGYTLGYLLLRSVVIVAAMSIPAVRANGTA
jgi:hypothetical protein